MSMGKTLAAIGLTGLVGAGVAWAADIVRAEQLASDKARRLVAGRAAGPAEDCLRFTPRTKLRIVDDSVVVAYDSVKQFNINLVAPGCTILREERAIVMDMNRRRVCAGDQFSVADLRTGIQYGACRWGQFVPFTRTTGHVQGEDINAD